MTDRPVRSGAKTGFPTDAQTGNDPIYNHQSRRLQDDFSETIFDQTSGPKSLDFTRPTWWRAFSPQGGRRPGLRNNLHIAIGLLELANVGDFPANYWNTIPIPRGIQGAMWVGGLLALSMLFFVCLDARRSLENIQVLRSERKRLNTQKHSLRCPPQPRKSCKCFLEVNKKELKSEYDRFAMVVILGSAALLVGIGTCIAPFGEKREIFQASNLLTGYVGNAPCAIYGLLNVYFARVLCLRAFRHRRAAQEKLEKGIVRSLVGSRTKRILIFSVSNGIAVLGAGAAAMCTWKYTHAYSALIIASLASFVLNWFWRHEIGYSRPIYLEVVEFEERHLLRAISDNHQLLERVSRREVPFGPTMEYIFRHDVFEEFCLDILSKRKLRDRILERVPCPVTVQIQGERLVAKVRNTDAEDTFRKGVEKAARRALVKSLKYRERWLLEMLGCHISVCSFSGKPICDGGGEVDLGGKDCDDLDLEQSGWISDISTAVETPEGSPNPSKYGQMEKLEVV